MLNKIITIVTGTLVSIILIVLGFFLIYLYIDEMGNRVVFIGVLGLLIAVLFILSGLIMLQETIKKK